MNSTGPHRDGHPGEPSAPGLVQLRSVPDLPALQYFLYTPTSRAWGGLPLLVSVHGISRNARQHAAALARAAERYGVAVLAPQFTRESFPDFQRLGVRSGRASDTALDAMVADAAAVLDATFDRFALFGYSAGGQFAHRYALTRPERIRAVAVAAPGWYTWPTLDRRFPYGLRPTPRREDLALQFERFLDLPLAVFVGSEDVRRDASLRCNEHLDREQGATRLERARRWVTALHRAAASRSRHSNVSLVELPHSGHDFHENVRTDRLDRRVLEFLFPSFSTSPCTTGAQT